MLITNEFATKIADVWIETLNNPNLESYINYYANDTVLVSNIALKLLPECNGRLEGLNLLISYSQLCRIKFPNYKFQKTDFLIDENKVIVYYVSLNENEKAIAQLTINKYCLINKVEVNYI